MHSQSTFSPTGAEEWRAVVGYEGWYEVSNLGRVRRIKAYGRRATGIIKAALDNLGYPHVSLSRLNVTTTRRVHRLVAIAFVANPIGKRYVNHIDGNKAHCAARNLEWVTTSENHVHAFATGLRHWRKKLSVDDIHTIRELAGTMTNQAIANIFGVSRVQISKIVLGQDHRYV